MTNFKDRFPSLKNRAKRMPRKSARGRSQVRVGRNIGNSIKLHRDSRARKRAEYLATLPKNPVARVLYRLHPKRVYGFFTSRDGIILSLKVIGVGLAVFLVFMLALFAYFRKDLPKGVDNLTTCSQGASSTYYDRTGQTLLWTSSGDVECFPVKYEDMSPYLRDAVVASEDKDFYKHGAFSMSGIIRAGISDLLKRGTTQGGSTITQQFVKNSLLSSQRSVTRKVKELILSIELERSYSKNQILTAYLNEIPFGSVYDGAEAASRGYFNKPAKDLTLDEAALLTAIIPAPTYYSPYGNNINELIDRQHHVIDIMMSQGYITKAQADAAKKVNVLAKLSTSSNKYSGIIAPYFVLQVQEQLEKQYGAVNVQKAGFKVITTLDLRLQKVAESVVADTMPKVVRNNGQNMAVDAEDTQTGQVLAQVGGRDFNYPGYGQENMAAIPRSPGSSFKPYDYSSLMTQKQNWGAGSTLYDLKTNFGYGYSPNDYDLKGLGAISMRTAIGQSRNIPAIKAMYIAGIQNTLDMAHKMGVVSGTSCEPNCGLSSAIGDGSEIRLDEHVNGYSTLARMGVYKPLTYVLKVQDRYGKTLQQWKNTPGTQVLDPQIAYIINSILSDPRPSYFGNSYRLGNGYKSAMKTGTTNSLDNGWMMGYTPNLAFGLWMGRQYDIKSMYNYTDTILGPAWNSFMTQANKILGVKAQSWTQPAGIKTVCINQATGYATTSGGTCDIFPSWYQPRYPGTTQKAVIDTVSGKLATNCTPDLARQTITSGGILSEVPSSDPLYNNFIKPEQARYKGSGGAIPSTYDDIHGQGTSATNDVCNDNQPSVSISGPSSSTNYKFTATVTQGGAPLKTLNFKIDGAVADGGSYDCSTTNCAAPSGITYTYIPTSSGQSHTIAAEIIDNNLYDETSNSITFTPTSSSTPQTYNNAQNTILADAETLINRHFTILTKKHPTY